MPAGTQVCGRCSDNFVVSTKLVTCKYCSESYHLQCVFIKDQLYKVINDCKNLFWYCDVCINLIDERLNIAEKLEKLEKHVEENKKSASEILQKLDNSTAIQENQNQWSTVVKRNKFPPIIIKPKDTNQDSTTTKKVVTQKINLSNMTIEVKNCKPVGQGTVVIECNDKESLEKLQNRAVRELSDGYKIEIPKIANPKVVIVGIHEKYANNEQEFINRIRQQSCLSGLEQLDIKIIRKFMPKNKQVYNVVLEVSPAIFKALLNNRRVFIEWDSYSVYEYINVLRCFKCWKYGHKAVHCKQVNIVCPLCSESHKSENCKAAVRVCTNCKHAHDILKIPDIDYKHSVFDKECICYKRAQKRVKSRTQYI